VKNVVAANDPINLYETYMIWWNQCEFESIKESMLKSECCWYSW